MSSTDAISIYTYCKSGMYPVLHVACLEAEVEVLLGEAAGGIGGEMIEHSLHAVAHESALAQFNWPAHRPFQ